MSEPKANYGNGRGLVVFSHGKESGPNGTKIQMLRGLADLMGYKTHSIDYTACKNEIERKEFLREYLCEQSGTIILVGSSMGGYVSAALANEFEIDAMFLMCPALYMPEFEPVVYKPKARKIVLVHGWSDDVVPVESSIRFAKEHGAILHILEDGHRLTRDIPHLMRWLKDLLSPKDPDELMRPLYRD